MQLIFLGDIRLIGDRGEVPSKRITSPFTRVQHLFGEPDVLCGNLECFFTKDLTNQKGSWKHPKVLRCAPAMVDTLAEAGFDLVNLANNHIMDGGPQGLKETISALNGAGISSFGAGERLDEAVGAVYLERAGKTIAFVGFGDNSHDYATKESPGVAPMEPFRGLLPRVEKMASTADAVVVQLHADLEFSEAPAPYRVKLSRALIDRGATLVIQHHPHVVQGVERYKHGLIAYSLGNFVFNVYGNAYQQGDPEARYGWILSIELDADAREVMDWEMEPVWIAEDHCPEPLAGAARETALREFERRCAVLRSPRQLRRIWLRRSWREARYHALMAYYDARRGHPIIAIKELIDLPMQPRNRFWIRAIPFLGF